ncbi:MAG TPA: hypothetical protein VF366_05230 [Dehalococcoidia bacterium]|jgi:hypothetical protein
MATKKTTKAKAKSKPAKKRTAIRKAPAGKTSRGDSYECELCGLIVTVDETCGCVEFCDIVCCGEPMKASRPKKK